MYYCFVSLCIRVCFLFFRKLQQESEGGSPGIKCLTCIEKSGNIPFLFIYLISMYKIPISFRVIIVLCFSVDTRAVEGCTGVMHVASPFPDATSKNVTEEEVMGPAKEGTLRVLKAIVAHAPTVKKVVQTSSFAAVFGIHACLLVESMKRSLVSLFRYSEELS